MRIDRSHRVRKRILACLAVPCLMAAVYVGFLSCVSLWVGMCNLNRSGFWVPILAGFAVLLAVLWIILTLIGVFIHSQKDEDALIV